MKNKRFIIIGIIVLIAFVIPVIYYFKLDDTFYEKNMEIGITIDGEYMETIPEKESEVRIQDIICDQGANGEWNEENWSFSVTNLTTTRTKCFIHFKSMYKEEILQGAEPVLKEGLIPVTISDDGVVKKADLYSEWYSYVNQKWANAVILEDESITYQEGEEIPEDNIESYFVWIPRYQYKLFNLGNYTSLASINKNAIRTIDVVFGNDTTNDLNEGECTTPMTSGNSGKCKVGDYMTHPAFLSFGVKGLWVGKFETGYKGATSVSGSQKNENNPNKIQIKPNVYSWRSISIANAHLSSYNYKREMDSHMMKNTEWGAVAYLQHSVYGSRKSVRINNNSNYITGYAAKDEPIAGYNGISVAGVNFYQGTSLNQNGTHTFMFNTPSGFLASTTANITGIYDMSGGSLEYVMGVMMTQSGVAISGNSALSNSGFNGPYSFVAGSLTTGINFPESKYYDKYAYGSSYTTFNRRILGDATGEMGPFASINYNSNLKNRTIGSWYQDEAWSLFPEVPWVTRGFAFSFGDGAGIFAFAHDTGSLSAAYGYRVVLAF